MPAALLMRRLPDARLVASTQMIHALHWAVKGHNCVTHPCANHFGLVRNSPQLSPFNAIGKDKLHQNRELAPKCLHRYDSVLWRAAIGFLFVIWTVFFELVLGPFCMTFVDKLAQRKHA